MRNHEFILRITHSLYHPSDEELVTAYSTILLSLSTIAWARNRGAVQNGTALGKRTETFDSVNALWDVTSCADINMIGFIQELVTPVPSRQRRNGVCEPKR